MLAEEMTEEPRDARSVSFRTPAAAGRAGFRVIIIGAGLSGICMGVKLREAGIPFVIYEKNDQVGGTWYENHYPGCAVDIPTHFYSFSFDLKDDWSRHFARHDEIWSYLDGVVDRFGIRDAIRFGHTVDASVWDEQAGVWRVSFTDAQGEAGVDEGRALVSGVGQLNRPLTPNIPGLDSFTGPAVHTARWDRDLDVKDKRVALVGTGASSMQVGPAIADEVARLMVFQRSPPWANPNPNYFKTVPPGMVWALKHVPWFARWHRALLSWASGDGFHAMLQVDPTWDQPTLSLNAENHAFRERLVAHIKAELEGRDDLIARVIPVYPPYGKRMLRDNNWYRMLRKENVALVDSGVSAISANAVIDANGVAHETDVIIFATGFETRAMLAPLHVVGRNGQTIRDAWGDDDPRAYMGMTTPGFPNLFIMFGPNTALSHGGSLFFHAECQTRYIMQCIRELIERDLKAMEVRPSVHDAYNRSVDEAHGRMVWAHKGMTSWYKNDSGRVFTNSPWRLVDYWKMTWALNPSDYVLTPNNA